MGGQSRPGEGVAVPRVAVVIPNWNGTRHLRECLNALRDQGFSDFETIVVDNGSTDDSVELLAGEFPWVKVIQLGENRGFAGAVNVGIRASTSEFVVLLNNDTRADEGFLEGLVLAMDEVPEASFGAAKMLLYDDPQLIDSAGDGFSFRLGAGISLGRLQEAAGYSERTWVFGACAGAAIYRRSLFEDIGLFDEDFFLVFEDVDLDMRAQLAVHRCLFVPDSIVLHKRGGSTVSSTEFQARCVRNAIWVAGKNLPVPLLLAWAGVYVPRMIFNLGRRLVQKIRQRHGGLSGEMPRLGSTPEEGGAFWSAFVPAVWDGVSRLPAKRRLAQRTRRAGSIELLRVIWNSHEPLG